jgi:hypothetical protein
MLVEYRYVQVQCWIGGKAGLSSLKEGRKVRSEVRSEVRTEEICCFDCRSSYHLVPSEEQNLEPESSRFWFRSVPVRFVVVSNFLIESPGGDSFSS